MFPVPNPIPADPSLTIEELFAGDCPPGHNPEAVLVLNLDALRYELEMDIKGRGYLPA